MQTSLHFCYRTGHRFRSVLFTKACLLTALQAGISLLVTRSVRSQPYATCYFTDPHYASHRKVRSTVVAELLYLAYSIRFSAWDTAYPFVTDFSVALILQVITLSQLAVCHTQLQLGLSSNNFAFEHPCCSDISGKSVNPRARKTVFREIGTTTGRASGQ